MTNFDMAGVCCYHSPLVGSSMLAPLLSKSSTYLVLPVPVCAVISARNLNPVTRLTVISLRGKWGRSMDGGAGGKGASLQPAIDIQALKIKITWHFESTKTTGMMPFSKIYAY